MAVRTLYLRIYLTIVAVLLVFSLVAGILFYRHAQSEAARVEASMQERAFMLVDLIARNLPPANADEATQREALEDWSHRLRVSVALQAADGHLIATSRGYRHFLEEAAEEAGADPARAAEYTGRVAGTAQRVPLEDGRSILMAKPWRRPPLRLDLGVLGEWFGGRGGGLPPIHDHGPDRGAPGGPDRYPMPPGPPGGSKRQVEKLEDSALMLVLPLVGLFMAIALGSYPVVRRLTRRLESLKRGVETFGAGDLSHRVDVSGDDEVAAVAGSFNRAAERIEELVRANRSLLANASHELRSPLARLKMAVAMMEDGDAPRRHALKKEVDRDIRELDALVEEVLLASRLDANAEMTQGPVDLVGVCTDEAARIGAQLALPVGARELTVPGNERLLRRAVRNLLENARRYGGEDVLLDLSQDIDAVEVRVGDRGPGVPADLRERIFEPFYRLPGHSEREGGVGLGLSLVRQIMQRHGGSVRCESREGGGSEFILRLPVSL